MYYCPVLAVSYVLFSIKNYLQKKKINAHMMGKLSYLITGSTQEIIEDFFNAQNNEMVKSVSSILSKDNKIEYTLLNYVEEYGLNNAKSALRAIIEFKEIEIELFPYYEYIVATIGATAFIELAPSSALAVGNLLYFYSVMLTKNMGLISNDKFITFLEDFVEKEESLINKAYVADMLGGIYSGKTGEINDIKAEKYYSITHNLFPNNQLYHSNLVRSYQALKQYQKAKPLLEQCIKEEDFSNKYKANCVNKLGLMYCEAKLGEADFAEAVKYHSIAYDLFPNNEVYTWNLVIVYEKLEQYEKAKPLFEQCVKEEYFSNKYKAECANELGWMYYEAKLGEADFDEAFKYHRIAYDLFPDNKLYSFNLAKAYQKSKQYEKDKLLFEQRIKE